MTVLRPRRRVWLVAVLCAIVGGVAASTSGAGDMRGNASSVTIGSAQPISNLDPYKTSLAWQNVLWPLLWCPLTQYTPTSALTPKPDLATKWSISKDLKRYLFTLNRKARFSDGTQITGQAVVDSINRALAKTTGWNQAAFFQTVSSVYAPSPSQVAINLTQPNNSLPALLTRLPIMDVAALSQVNTKPVGCGPYQVSDFTPNDHVTLVPNANYWGPKAKVGTLNLVTTADLAAATAQLRSGGLQVLFQPPFADVKQLKSAGFKIVQSPVAGTGYIIGPDDAQPPFNNPKARQALAMSINRAAIAKAVYAGLATPTASPLLKSDPFYSKPSVDLSYNLKRAKVLWNEAGVNSSTHLVYWSTPINSAFDPIGEILQASLAKIGIHLDIQSVDVGTWVSRFVPQPRDFGAGYMVIDGFKGPTPTQLVYLTPIKCDCDTTDAKLTKLLDEAEAAPTVKKQKAILAQWQDEFATNSPTTIVAIYSEPMAVAPSVTGVWKDPNENPRLESIAVR